MQLKRRKFSNSGTKEKPQIRSPQHLAWVRRYFCAVQNDACEGRVEAAHARTGTDGGMGVKPGDNWAIPLCTHHHAIQHRIGEQSFETQYKINMKRLAEHLWDVSPHGKRYRMEHQA